jgi:Ca2+-binding EF-hand superfamily protein
VFRTFDSDNDGILDPVQFRSVFDWLRDPGAAAASAVGGQALSLSDEKAEDAAFFALLNEVDPYNTDRITFTDVVTVADRLRYRLAS